jgi:hypothetical protein
MTTQTVHKRRSERILLTVPLMVEGVDVEGNIVEYEGRATSLNRYGARIQIPQVLDRGQAVRLRSPIGHYEADFRVVESLVSPQGDSREYGVECMNDIDEKDNLWGIEFPTSAESDKASAKVLLECGMCHTMALMPLTLLEIETIRTIGMVGLACQKCVAETPWKYAEVPALSAAAAMRTGAEKQSNPAFVSGEAAGRDHRRVYMQMPLELRDSQNNLEVAQTENVSKCGFCFSSDKKYLRGEIVMAIFPLDSKSPGTELPARIVRERVIEGSNRKIYGATFQPPASSRTVAA